MSRHFRISQGIREAVLTPMELPSREDTPPDFSYGSDHLAKYFQTEDGVSYEVSFFLVKRTDVPKDTWSLGFDSVTERESENKFEVIQGVVAALREFIQEKDPSGLYYAATSLSRERLYKALFKRLLPDSQVQNFTATGRYIPLAEELQGEHPQPGF